MNAPLVREKRSKLGYRALDSELREIRILSIRPNFSSRIECSLEHASLLTCPLYKALSYTWGDPSDTTDISLNGYSFPVTQNLATALQHIRSCTETVSFWIDAVCIDQEDTQERSEQVQYMKAIYEQAQEVLIWLGPDNNDGGFAIESMNTIYDGQITSESKSGGPPGFVPPTIGDRFLKALDLLLDRDWWTRVWVIQEATCPSETYFMCGRYKTEFTRVTTTVIQILLSRIRQALHPGSKNPDLVRFQKVTSLHSIRQGRIDQNEDLDLLSLLDQSRTRKASDLSDKLYALFGLATNTLGGELNPNYSIPVDEAFIRFVDRMIEIQGNLDVLGHCEGPGSSGSRESPKSSYLRQLLNPVPSWVPNWSKRLDVTAFAKKNIRNNTHIGKLYNASDGYPPTSQLLYERRIILLRGFTFDIVSEVGVEYTQKFGSLTLQLWKAWISRVLSRTYQAANINRKHPTFDSTLCDAFLRTIVADLGEMGKRLPKFQSGLTWPPDRNIETENLLSSALSCRRLFISQLGYIGLARYDVAVGDTICVLHGGQVLYILERKEPYHRFKGECYVHGLMDGEAMDYPKVWQDFALQ